MKYFLTFIFSLLFVQNIIGQNLEYKQFTKQNKGNHYRSYLAKDSVLYKVGDFVKIGTPSSVSYKNIFIFQMLGYLQMSVSDNHLLDEKCKIISIGVVGKKRTGYNAFFQVSNDRGNFFSIDIEKAIESGEALTNRLTEDEAITLLKKEKDKLDLEIITKEEYEKKKKELMKYIKN